MSIQSYTFAALIFFGTLFGCQCSPDRLSDSRPIVKIPPVQERVIVWSNQSQKTIDPSTACVSCHEDIVKRYQTSSKYKTSRPIDPETMEAVASAKITVPRHSVAKAPEQKLRFTESIPFEQRSRAAVANLSIGSQSKAFSANIASHQRLMPLQFNSDSKTLSQTLGYRHRVVTPFQSQTSVECSGCHGLHEGKASQHGIPCEACHGDTQGHHDKVQQKNATPHKNALSTFDGQSRICGQCHTHAKARLYEHQRKMTPLPSTHSERFHDLIIYARDEYRDERASGHGKLLSESKCFSRDATTIPKCSDCHEPHDHAHLSKRTRKTCQGCHEDFKPCLNTAARQPDARCEQCHFSHLTQKKHPHKNRLIHKIVRVPTNPAYWGSIMLRRLTQTFSPIRSLAKSEAAKEAEKALVSLQFTRNRDKPNQVQALKKARQKHPNTESTLALLRWALDNGNLDEAKTYTREYEIARSLPDEATSYWARTYQQMKRHQDALTLLEAQPSSSPTDQMLKVFSYIQLQQTPQAASILFDLKDTQLENPEYLLRLAEVELQRHRPLAAQHWLDKLISVDPSADRAFVLLASIFRDIHQDRRSAIDILTNGLVFNPHSVDILNLRGALHEAEENLAQASLDWEASLRVFRSQFDIYVKLFHVAIATGDRNSAKLLIGRGQQFFPDDKRWEDLIQILEKRRK